MGQLLRWHRAALRDSTRPPVLFHLTQRPIMVNAQTHRMFPFSAFMHSRNGIMSQNLAQLRIVFNIHLRVFVICGRRSSKPAYHNNNIAAGRRLTHFEHGATVLAAEAAVVEELSLRRHPLHQVDPLVTEVAGLGRPGLRLLSGQGETMEVCISGLLSGTDNTASSGGRLPVQRLKRRRILDI